MSLHTITLDARARHDFFQARRWYRQQSAHPARQFNDELLCAVDAIQDAPLRWRERRPSTRRLILQRFPYSVFYQVSARQIVIVALLHRQRDANTRFPDIP